MRSSNLNFQIKILYKSHINSLNFQTVKRQSFASILISLFSLALEKIQDAQCCTDLQVKLTEDKFNTELICFESQDGENFSE